MLARRTGRDFHDPGRSVCLNTPYRHAGPRTVAVQYAIPLARHQARTGRARSTVRGSRTDLVLRNPLLGIAGRGEHGPNEIGGVSGTELLHDVGAVVFDGAR